MNRSFLLTRFFGIYIYHILVVLMIWLTNFPHTHSQDPIADMARVENSSIWLFLTWMAVDMDLFVMVACHTFGIWKVLMPALRVDTLMVNDM